MRETKLNERLTYEHASVSKLMCEFIPAISAGIYVPVFIKELLACTLLAKPLDAVFNARATERAPTQFL